MSLRPLYTIPSLRTFFRPHSNIPIRLYTMASQSPLLKAQEAPETPAAYQPRYVDIGINLADPIFQGFSGGKQRHPNDLDAVVSRAKEVGCTKLIITGSDFQSISEGRKLAANYPNNVFVTAGIHPCNSNIFAANIPEKKQESDEENSSPQPMDESIETSPERCQSLIDELMGLIQTDKASDRPCLVAMGEFGLDYDRLHYCSKRLQLASFRAQLQASVVLSPQLPLFLHSRAAHRDFVTCMKEAFGEALERLEKGGVVHSFTGTLEEMKELANLGLYIGVNGCSLKTEENCAVVKEIPLDKLMLETDGPWCEVRPSHEGWKYLLEKEEPATPAPAPTPASIPALQSVTNGDVAAVGDGGVSTATSSDTGADRPKQQQRRQKQQQQPKKGKQQTPQVPSRFKVVKKEKWEEGAMIKGRNEPCMIERVAKIVAGIKGLSEEEVCEVAWANTLKVFDLGEEK